MVESWRANSATEPGLTAPIQRRSDVRQRVPNPTADAVLASPVRVSIETGTQPRVGEDAQHVLLGRGHLDPLVGAAFQVAGAVVVAGHQSWSASVARRTSSMVVTPSSTLRMPLLRSVTSPSLTARCLILVLVEPVQHEPAQAARHLEHLETAWCG